MDAEYQIQLVNYNVANPLREDIVWLWSMTQSSYTCKMNQQLMLFLQIITSNNSKLIKNIQVNI